MDYSYVRTCFCGLHIRGTHICVHQARPMFGAYTKNNVYYRVSQESASPKCLHIITYTNHCEVLSMPYIGAMLLDHAMIHSLVVLLQVRVQVLCPAERSPQLSCSVRIPDCLQWDLQQRGSTSVRVVLQGGAELREGGAGVVVKVPRYSRKQRKSHGPYI